MMFDEKFIDKVSLVNDKNNTLRYIRHQYMSYIS